MKRWIVVLSSACCFVSGYARGQSACSDVPKGDPRWQQIDGQYARIERAMIAKDAKQLFAVYTPIGEMANAFAPRFPKTCDLN
ncbi:MAG: hypothetical protein HRJ53_11340 [Acidobacteria bacterium Pan2503]|uniref:Uncharacterized protein n=1 Tax=Candidatus Acidiferrum panamense TaxID=2741543 RepID=A0A7V8NQH0_9BACT|nr:hypothetical protein [Candidatus Acidoferrum panamensis]